MIRITKSQQRQSVLEMVSEGRWTRQQIKTHCRLSEYQFVQALRELRKSHRIVAVGKNTRYVFEKIDDWIA